MGNSNARHETLPGKEPTPQELEQEKVELRCALVLLKRRKHLDESDQKTLQVIVQRLRELEGPHSQITETSVETHSEEDVHHIKKTANDARAKALPDVNHHEMSEARQEARRFLRHLERQSSIVHHETLQDVFSPSHPHESTGSAE